MGRVAQGGTKAIPQKILVWIIATSALLFLQTSCGKLPSTESRVENSNIELSAPGQGVDSKSGGTIALRANGYDSVELVAKVRGLSGRVGFFIAEGWGSFPNGEVSDDGFRYFTANSSGQAQATLVAGVQVGDTDVIAKSLSSTAILTVEFSYATFTILPSNLTLQDKNGAWANVRAIGGAPPIEWSSSNPAAVHVKKISETEATVFVHDAASFDSKVTIFATDSVGASDNISVMPGATDCVDATLSISNSAPKAGEILSITLDDYDRVSQSSVDISYSGATSGVITLSQWQAPGVFKGNFTIPAGASAGDSYTFSVVDQDSTCSYATISKMATVQ